MVQQVEGCADGPADPCTEWHTSADRRGFAGAMIVPGDVPSARPRFACLACPRNYRHRLRSRGPGASVQHAAIAAAAGRFCAVQRCGLATAPPVLDFPMKTTLAPIAEVISQGGRTGSVESADDGFRVEFREPSEDNPSGVTPEHLFGAAWAACYHGAVR